MNGSDKRHFPIVMKRRSDGFDLIVFGRQQMRSAQDEMDGLAGGRLRSLDDGLDGCVAAAHNEHDAIRRIDGQRNFPQLKVCAPFASQ